MKETILISKSAKRKAVLVNGFNTLRYTKQVVEKFIDAKGVLRSKTRHLLIED